MKFPNYSVPHKNRVNPYTTDTNPRILRLMMNDKNAEPEDGTKLSNEDVFDIENHIYFRTGVNQASIDKVINIIEQKNRDFKNVLKDNPLVKDVQPSPLYLHITSNGGSVMSAFKLIDAMGRSVMPVYTIVDGHAASAGTMISVMGKKRFMTRHGYMLIHELSTMMGGKYKELKDDWKNAKQFMKDIEKLYTTKTKITSDEFKKIQKHDLWWGFDVCLEKGLVDGEWLG